MLLSRQAQVNGTDVDSGCTETKLLCRARYGGGGGAFCRRYTPTRQTLESDVLVPLSSPFATVHRQRVAKSPMSWRTGYYLRFGFGCAGTRYKTSLNQAKTQMLNAMFSS